MELVPITTTGDQQQSAIRSIGGEGVFTKEMERALLDGRIDLAVHSLKDLPTGVTAGTGAGGRARAGRCRRVLVCKKERGSITRHSRRRKRLPPPFPAGVRGSIGTGSLRRRAQLLSARPDLQMKDIRGNVDTRLRKLAQGDFDALILAEAGLQRLGSPSTSPNDCPCA